MTKPDLEQLARMGNLLRQDVLTMVHLAGDGHPGPALSAADIVAALYFQVLRVDPARPLWPQRDRFILSKGHACPVVYAALARRGYFDPAILPTLRSLGSILQGHPVMGKPPGIDMTTGSLGHGLAVGSGMALAGRMQGLDYSVYVVMGDGELNEGIVWEGAQVAAHQKLGRLIAFVDHNGYQSGGLVGDVSGMADDRGQVRGLRVAHAGDRRPRHGADPGGRRGGQGRGAAVGDRGADGQGQGCALHGRGQQLAQAGADERGAGGGDQVPGGGEWLR